MLSKNTELHTNPHVEAATIQMLAVNLKHGDATDEYGEEAGQAIERCWSRMGLPDPENLTVKQLARHDAVMKDSRQSLRDGAGSHPRQTCVETQLIGVIAGRDCFGALGPSPSRRMR